MQPRQSAAAGVLYPADREDLVRMIESMLEAVPRSEGDLEVGSPRAIVVPHGPYESAGPIAAAGWARVLASTAPIDRIVVLGPAHHAPFRGVAAPFDDALETPLGGMPVDRVAIESVRSLPHFLISDAPHEQESSVEVHVPFAQTVARAASIVPLVVGDDSERDAGAVLDRLWRDDTLVVVSCDLSRYHEAPRALRLDEATASGIEHLDAGSIRDDQVCGASALRATLQIARHRGLRASRLALRHCGSPDEVMGFGAFALCAPAERSAG